MNPYESDLNEGPKKKKVNKRNDERGDFPKHDYVNVNYDR
jgi:hypothetical protein